MHKLWLVGLGLMLGTTVAGAAAPLREGVLPEDQAYQVTAAIRSPGVLAVHWVIAQHYYLYRGRMKFAAGNGVALGKPVFPAGTQEHDEYLGDVEIYHDEVTATIPYTLDPGTKVVQLTVGYQGCHEVRPKLCYPPTTKAFNLSVPVAPTATATAAHSGVRPTTAGSSKVESSAYDGTPAAREAVKAGDAAYGSGKVDVAINEYRKAIMLDPEYADGQARYVGTLGSENIIRLRSAPGAGAAATKAAKATAIAQDNAVTRKLLARYEALSTQHPKNPVYPWVVGQYADAYHLTRAQESYCKQAVKADANFGPGWSCLANIAMLHGDHQTAAVELRRAMRAAPDDDSLAAVLATNLTADGETHATEIEALVRRFPQSRMVAKALVDAANKLQSEKTRVAELERLHADATGSNTFVTQFAARSLYPYYVANDLPKAASLARGMAGQRGSGEAWAARATLATGLVNAQRAIDAGHAQAALVILQSAKEKDADTLSGEDQWYLLDACALDMAGRTSEGVIVLRDRFMAQPSDAVYAAMVAYGAKVGEPADAVNQATWAALRAKAKRAFPFTLARLDDNKPVSLSDFQGKPVIIDFWFPTCDNCRIAFPYLNDVANKFADQGLTVLAINIVKSEQPLAQPYLHGMGYRFVGLAGDQTFASNAYGVIGAPTTVFIGPDGNILFELPVGDTESQRSAEAAVKFMLTGAKPVARHAVAVRAPRSSSPARDAG